MDSLGVIWERFVGGGEPDLRGLRPAVRDSWLRCKQANLNPETQAAPMILSAAEFAQTRARSRLYRASKKTMPIAREYLPNKTDATVILIDADCVMLDIQGGGKGIIAAETAGGVAGSRWLEADTGTDALSLCVHLGAPAAVIDFEHYCVVGHQWTGAAVPIFQPGNRALMGALAVYNYGITKPNRIIRYCSTFASLIERELEKQASDRHLAILAMHERFRSSHPHDKIIAIDDYGQLLADRGEWIVPPESFETVKAKIEEQFSAGARLTEIEAPVHNRTGKIVDAHFFAATVEEEIAGFVAVVPNLPKKSSTKIHQSWKAGYEFEKIVGRASALLRCVEDARRYAITDLPVLIRGESGTGKELFAQAIHNASNRRDRPFVAINCGASRDELLAAELFGYSDGSFTGASRGGKSGKLEIAEGGTIFLDEIESMSPYMQAALLRVLEEGKFSRIGGSEQRPMNVRFLGATNAELRTKSGGGNFRSDLYFRLASLILFLPPLRERQEDIHELIEYYAPSLLKEMSAETLGRLTKFCWPGNVRQLKNVLGRAEVRRGDQTGDRDILDDEVCQVNCRQEECQYRDGRAWANVSDETSEPSSAEKARIIDALQQCGWNVTAAANRLGIHRVTLSKKLSTLQIRKSYV